jgi:hypothetical protein
MSTPMTPMAARVTRARHLLEGQRLRVLRSAAVFASSDVIVSADSSANISRSHRATPFSAPTAALTPASHSAAW